MNTINNQKGESKMSEKTLIDTSILLNAYFFVNKNNKIKAIEIIEKYANTENGYVSSQNILEFTNICKNKLKVKEKELIGYVHEIKTLFKIVSPTEKSIESAINLSFSKKIAFYDALLIQTMIENSIRQLLTSDHKLFKKIKEIKTIDPYK